LDQEEPATSPDSQSPYSPYTRARIYATAICLQVLPLREIS
jgi:hypothetical protein